MAENLDPTSLYFREIKQLPQRSKEELDKLWKKAKRGNKKAKKHLIEANLRLVIPIVKKYYRPGIDFLDLVEEGNLGLMQAVDKFKPSKGFRFSTYAAYWIEQAIRRAVEEQAKTIRIPPHAWDALRKWFKEWDKLSGQTGRNPTLSEMSQRLQLSTRQIRGILDTSEIIKAMGSLDSPINAEENIFVKDTISDSESHEPENLIYALKLHSELAKALKTIGERESKILQLRFGLLGYERMTLEEVGKKLKISRERVRQLEERAMFRLKRAAQRMGLA